MHYFLPSLSVLLLSLTLPFADLGFLAWIALIPLLLYIQLKEVDVKKAIIAGGLVVGAYVFILLWPLTTVNVWWWVDPTSWMFQNKELILVGTVIILSAYGGFLFGGLFAFWYKRYRNPFILGIVWSILEIVRLPLVANFTWGILGYSQHSYSQIVWITQFISVVGLSGIIVCVNAFLAHAIEQRSYKHTIYSITIIMIVVVGSYLPSNEPQRTSLVSVLHAESTTEDLYDKLLTKEIISITTSHLLENSPDLFVLPENIFPGTLLSEDNTFEHSKQDTAFSKLLLLSQENPHTIFFVGAHRQDMHAHIYNSMIAVQGGQIIGIYDKQDLLPLGEKTIPGLQKNHTGVFTPGKKQTLALETYTIKPLICSEIATQTTNSKADILINISNDSIFESDVVTKQNMIIAKVHSIQSQTPLLRSSKKGISAIISPDGTVKQAEGSTQIMSTLITY